MVGSPSFDKAVLCETPRGGCVWGNLGLCLLDDKTHREVLPVRKIVRGMLKEAEPCDQKLWCICVCQKIKRLSSAIFLRSELEMGLNMDGLNWFDWYYVKGQMFYHNFSAEVNLVHDLPNKNDGPRSNNTGTPECIKTLIFILLHECIVIRF